MPLYTLEQPNAKPSVRKNGGHKQIQCGPNKQCTYVGGFVVCLNNGGRMQNSHLATRSLVHGIVHCVNCVYRIEYISGAPTITQKTLERRMFLTLLWKSLSSILAVCFSVVPLVFYPFSGSERIIGSVVIVVVLDNGRKYSVTHVLLHPITMTCIISFLLFFFFFFSFIFYVGKINRWRENFAKSARRPLLGPAIEFNNTGRKSKCQFLTGHCCIWSKFN